MSGDRAWNEMLEEFGVLGGTAENVHLGIGPHGRGLFPVDAARPVRIHIPENLLVDADKFVVQDGAVRIAPDAAVGAGERAFLERYENDFSWGAGGRADTERFFAEVQALPEPVRRLLAGKLGVPQWLEDATPERVLARFLETRTFGYGGRTVVMPIIELANHGNLSSYGDKDGISLEGRFADEVLVRYSASDSFQIFLTWGFGAETPLALSVGGKMNTRSGRAVVIRREFDGRATDRDALWIPQVSMEGGDAALSYLMVGNRQYPRLAKGIFYRLMREAGFANVEETFDTIQHMNRMYFLDLIGAIEGFEGPMIRALRDMARFQLTAMSHCYGVREVEL